MINSEKEDFWKCPKSSCNLKEIKISRNDDNIIDSRTYTDIIIHFLQHLSQDNPLFGSTDIIKIFLDHTPKGILSVEDKGEYIYDGRTSDKIWKNQIRSALNSLRSKGYIDTENSLDVIEKFSENVKDRRKLRKRKRTDLFKTDFDLFDDWKILQSNGIIEKEKKYWIFQSNPKLYNLERAVNEIDEDLFRVTRYKNKIEEGDKVFFWISGENAGIVGFGDILSDPKMFDNLEEFRDSEKFIVDDEFRKESENKDIFRVKVSYNPLKKISKNEIISMLEQNEINYSGISIFKSSQGTNFPIDKEIWDLLKINFIEGDESKVPRFFNPGIKIGQRINNAELMEIFKVSNSGGMRRSHQKNSLVLVSDHTKGLYGDRWEDEILHYTGMGLTGDQSLEFKQNKTLYESSINGINLFLFEVFEPRKYTYKGKTILIGEPYQENQLDKDGKMRKVWIFPLQLTEDKPGIKSETPSHFFAKKKILNSDLINPQEIEYAKNLVFGSKQIILYGPPGTGKTYFARILAQEIAEDRYEIIQFHPSYSYEDFVEWIEAIPSDDEQSVIFKPKPRIFRRLCEVASRNPYKNIVLIIDEINRGDLGRIFGELILGLEPDYRNLEINTPLSDSLGRLKIPNRLYIIGTMNSVDRSIAIVDYALRRRFLFYPMMPKLEIIEKWVDKSELNLTEDFKKKIINLFKNLNRKIREEPKLSKHYQIGHTYFFVKSEEELKTKWEYMIKPLLEEYFNFNEEDLSNYKYDDLIQG